MGEKKIEISPGAWIPRNMTSWIRFLEEDRATPTGTRDFYENPKRSIERILSSYLEVFAKLTLTYPYVFEVTFSEKLGVDCPDLDKIALYGGGFLLGYPTNQKLEVIVDLFDSRN